MGEIQSRSIKAVVLFHQEDEGLKNIVIDVPGIGTRIICVDNGMFHEPDFKGYPSKDFEKAIEKCKEGLIADYEYSSQSEIGLTFEKSKELTEIHGRKLKKIEKKYA